MVERALGCVVCVDGELESLWRGRGGATGSRGHCACSGSASGGSASGAQKLASHTQQLNSRGREVASTQRY